MAQLANVNTTDVRAAIELGCRCMSRIFNEDDPCRSPWFASRIVPRRAHADTALTFTGSVEEAHTTGRHLNALLNAEDAAGIDLDEDAVQTHARSAYLTFSGPVCLPLNRPEPREMTPVNFQPHNCREGMHALVPLIQFRHDERAFDLAKGMIDAVYSYWKPVTRWDWAALGAKGIPVREPGAFITEEARLIGPLVKLYRATGYGPALELALTLSDVVTTDCFRADGAFNMERFGTHTHSTTCVMSSLAQLADLLHDSALMQRVKAFYDHGLNDIRDAIGWVIESVHPERVANYPDRGECNNTGDIIETALILGRGGWPHYFHDAERMLRCHLLPAQLRDVSWIVEPENPDNLDGKRRIADRHLGAFGFPAPYANMTADHDWTSFNMDIVGGSVGSLCEVLRAATRKSDGVHHVNLLFDHETADVRVCSPYAHGKLEVTTKTPGPLLVRVPPWVERGALRVSGVTGTWRFVGDHVFVAQPVVRSAITLEFALPTEELVLKHRTRAIRVRLRGDEVAAMDNFGADLSFFKPYA